MTLMCIPARVYLLPRIFTQWELLLVDGDPDDITKWCDRKEAAQRGEYAVEAGDEEMGEFAREEKAMIIDDDDDSSSVGEHSA
jgi:hypothetical protein